MGPLADKSGLSLDPSLVLAAARLHTPGIGPAAQGWAAALEAEAATGAGGGGGGGGGLAHGSMGEAEAVGLAGALEVSTPPASSSLIRALAGVRHFAEGQTPVLAPLALLQAVVGIVLSRAGRAARSEDPRSGGVVAPKHLDGAVLDNKSR